MKGWKNAVTLAAVCALSIGALAQQPQPGAWQYAKREDPLHGTSFDAFTLTGEYLSPLEASARQQPRLVVLCSRGKFKQAFLDTGMVIEAARNAGNGGLARSFKGAVQAAVEIREDNKKPGTNYWEITNDSRALSFDHGDLTDLLTGHMMGTEKNWKRPVRRLIFGVIEFGGNEVEMQFTTPDAEGNAPLVRACGLEVRGSFWRGYHRAK